MAFLLVFLLVIAVLAVIFGWAPDSRDYADWRPTDNGVRCPPR